MIIGLLNTKIKICKLNRERLKSNKKTLTLRYKIQINLALPRSQILPRSLNKNIIVNK